MSSQLKPPSQAMSVTELTACLKSVVEQTFPSVWVAGELSDLARPRSGHLYFTLKDDHAQIRGVMWRSVASRLKFDLDDGQEILCYGDLEVYPPRGTYQIVVRKVQPRGLGGLQLAFQQLQAKLQAEGLFAAERKRPIPSFPTRLGVITSPTGAALRDFLQAAKERWPGAEIVIIPAQVQGSEAPRSILSALSAAHRIAPALDLIVLTRGGGSLEDLWSFNEESVVRAVSASRIPTISAVGHEIDVTLCDFAADLRALTPTDAAIKALPDSESVGGAVRAMRQRLEQILRTFIRHNRQRLELLSQQSVLRNPFELLHARAQRLDEADAQARRAVLERVKTAHARLGNASASLNALSPLHVLARGYSLTTDKDGRPLSDASRLSEGDLLVTRLHRGSVTSTVTGTKPSDP